VLIVELPRDDQLLQVGEGREGLHVTQDAWEASVNQVSLLWPDVTRHSAGRAMELGMSTTYYFLGGETWVRLALSLVSGKISSV
jgi:hypothetical protein